LDKQKIAYFKGTARVDNLTNLENEIKNSKPTHVLSLIGRTHGKIGDKVFSTIDYLEEDGKLVENIRDNLFSPLSLAILCKKYDIHFTYLGTGCIFEFDSVHPFGTETNGFREDSEPNFFGSSYSVVKGFTDKLMHLFTNVLNLRIRMPINADINSRNFITKITSYEKICSIPNSMTVLPILIPIAIDLMQKSHIGTLNLTNPGLISHNEILTLYKQIVDPNFEWKNFNKHEQNQILSSKRSNNYLDTTLLEKLYPDVPKIYDAIIKCLESYPKPIPEVPIPEVPISEVPISEVLISKVRIPEVPIPEVPISEVPNSKTILQSSIANFTELKIKSDFLNSTETNLLVTGGYGFIGSHFINHMFDTYDKINIINIDAMYYCAS